MGLGRFIQEEKVNRRGKKREEVMLASVGAKFTMKNGELWGH